MNGVELKSHFKLDSFARVYIQKVLNSTVPIYVISFNSRYKTQHIPRKLLQFNNSSMLYRFRGPQAKFSKLSPPVAIEGFRYDIGANAFIMIRDLGGERYVSHRDIFPLNLKDNSFNLNNEY